MEAKSLKKRTERLVLKKNDLVTYFPIFFGVWCSNGYLGRIGLEECAEHLNRCDVIPVGPESRKTRLVVARAHSQACLIAAQKGLLFLPQGCRRLKWGSETA